MARRVQSGRPVSYGAIGFESFDSGRPVPNGAIGPSLQRESGRPVSNCAIGSLSLAQIADALGDGAFDDDAADAGSLPDTVPRVRYGNRPADVSWSAALTQICWCV